MNETLKQIAIGVVGSLVTFLIIAIWSWISGGGLLHFLGGLSATRIDEELRMVRMQVISTNQKIQDVAIQSPEVYELFTNAIVMTEEECAALGTGWERYEGMSGRFPLAAGQTTDARDEKKSFVLGQTGGAYLHQLTVDEMPSHTHSFHGSRSERRGDDWDNETVHRDETRTTNPMGGDQPHNNMPPYLVINFCHYLAD